MADIYTSTSGSNTSPYETWAKAATNPQEAVNESGDGDTVWFDDEDWNLSSGLDFSSRPTGTTTFRSRSDDPSTCSLYRASATARLLGFSSMVNAPTLIFRGFSIYNTTAFTAGGGGVFGWISGADANITFQNTKFRDTTVNGSINSLTTGAFLRTSAAAVSRTITFIDCTYNNLTVTATSCGSFISLHTNNKLVATNQTITNIAVNVTGVHAGMFYGTDDMTIANDDINGVTLNGIAGSANIMNGIYHIGASTGTMTITGGIIQNITSVGHAVHSLYARSYGPYVVSGITVHDCSMSRHGDDSLGLAFLAYASGASGTYDDCEVYNCSAQNGAGLYHSQGASAVISRLKAYNNTGAQADSGQFAAGGAIYSGGWGDLTLNDCLIYGNTVNNTDDVGGGLYLHLWGSSTTNKTVTINGCTIADNIVATDGGAGIHVRNANVTYTLTVSINNTIIDNNTGDLEVITDGAGAKTLNMDYCFIDGGSATEAPDFTSANEITTDPELLPDYKLPTGSSAKRAGKFIFYGAKDVRGRRRAIPPTLGAYESTSGDQAEARTVEALRTVATIRTAASARTALS